MQNEATTQAAARATAPRGMSLLEIMIVITLIGLVTATIGVAVMGSLADGQTKLASTQAKEIAAKMESFRLNNYRYPTTSEGIAILVKPPKGRPIMDEIPKDPWGNEYIYTIPGAKNPSKFDVRSKGEDGKEGTEDDVGNWSTE